MKTVLTLNDFALKPLARILLPLGLGLLAAGCSVTPQPLKQSEVVKRVQEDQFKIYSSQEQVFHPICFTEAVARSLKYNLDYRLKLMESALSAGLLEVTKFDMLPNLLVSAGYTARNNLTASSSFSIDPTTGAVTNNQNSYSGGADKTRWTAGAELSWNILDFGVGYYRAKQKADEVMIAEERRRRVVQNILQDVRSAYWRAVGAQRLAREAEALMAKAQTALERSREAEAQGLLPPRDALNYQRILLDAVQLLSSRRQELDYAKRELAALMNMTPGTEFTVAEEEEPTLMPAPLNVAELEELALINRPELRQEDYQTRITAAEARKQLLYLLPNLNLSVGAQYDSNSYLYNNNWLEASGRVSFNLMKAFAIPSTQQAQSAQVAVDDMRRMALSMAVLTQVRVAIERYRMALRDLDIAKESSEVDQRMVTYAKAAQTTRADTELELIRAETRALNSEFQRFGAYAAAQAAFGRIYASLGLEVVPPNVEDSESVAKLGRQISKYLAEIERETFVHYKAVTPAHPELVLQIEDAVEARADGSTSPASLDADSQGQVQASVIRALERNQVMLRPAPSKVPVLSLQLVTEAVKNGTRRAYWQMRLKDAEGKVIGESRYASTLPSKPSAGAVAAFAEAATVSSMKTLRGWLTPKHD